MFENLKKKIGHYLINKRYCQKEPAIINYNHAVEQSSDFFVIMPKDDNDFYHSLDLIKYLLNQRKHITLFLPEFKYSLIPEKDKYKFVSFHPQQITRFYVPDKSLESILRAKEFDIVIDLNREDDLFYSAVTNIVNTKLRVGFARPNSERYYNLQYRGKNGQPEGAYPGFLSFLKMF